MYGGMMMERGTVEDIFYRSKHPYTKGLQSSIPHMDKHSKDRLVPIPGSPVDLMNPPKGCPFAPRCPYAMKVCVNRAGAEGSSFPKRTPRPAGCCTKTRRPSKVTSWGVGGNEQGRTTKKRSCWKSTG